MWQGVARGMNAYRTVCGAHRTLQAQAIKHAETHAHSPHTACCMKSADLSDGQRNRTRAPRLDLLVQVWDVPAVVVVAVVVRAVVLRA